MQLIDHSFKKLIIDFYQGLPKRICFLNSLKNVYKNQSLNPNSKEHASKKSD